MQFKEIENKLEELLAEAKIDESLNFINNELKDVQDSNSRIELLFLKARVYSKLNKHNEAINLYNTILKEDPTNQKAKNKKEYTEEIVKFLRSDIYASPNTWMDPWE